MNEKCPLYLQLEVSWWKGKGKLCFKVDAEDEASEEKREDLQRKWQKRVCDASEQQAKPSKIGRSGANRTVPKWKTVAEWKGKWLAFDEDSGRLDINGTVRNLEQAEAMLTRAVEG